MNSPRYLRKNARLLLFAAGVCLLLLGVSAAHSPPSDTQPPDVVDYWCAGSRPGDIRPGPGGTPIPCDEDEDPYLLTGTRGNETVRPYLRVWADAPRGEAYTWEQITIVVESQTAQLINGSLVLEPSRSTVSVSILDTDGAVIVFESVEPMFLGRAEIRLTIDELWTSTLLNVSVVDYANGLIGFTTFRTRESDVYSRWLDTVTLQRVAWDPVNRAITAAEASANTAWAVAVLMTALLTFLMLVIFLKVDHRRATRMRAPSLWVRFRDRAWPYPLVPDEWMHWMDVERTWDKESALFFAKSRRHGYVRSLEREKAAIDVEILQLIGKAPVPFPEKRFAITPDGRVQKVS